MANTKQWVIAAFDCKPQEEGQENVVFNIHWRKKATETVGDKTYAADTYGACTVGAPDAENFIAFEDLTEEVVITWLEAVLDVETIDRQLDAQIEDQKNPPVVTKTVPWQVEIIPAPISE